jgi:hypothetical protein
MVPDDYSEKIQCLVTTYTGNIRQRMRDDHAETIRLCTVNMSKSPTKIDRIRKDNKRSYFPHVLTHISAP